MGLGVRAIFGVVVALGAALGVSADPRNEGAAACDAWEIEYSLAAQVELSNTLLGAGDGVHTIGPGRLVVRFENRGGRAAGRARLLSYDMQDDFTVVSSALFFRTEVTNATRTTATPAACGIIAEGELKEQTLRWTSPINGLRTDGAVTCAGAFCGRFGAPPEGTSAVHTPPHAVTFAPFELGAELKTFSMAYSVVSKMDSPRQTSRIALVGREVRRTCVAVAPCR